MLSWLRSMYSVHYQACFIKCITYLSKSSHLQTCVHNHKLWNPAKQQWLMLRWCQKGLRPPDITITKFIIPKSTSGVFNYSKGKYGDAEVSLRRVKRRSLLFTNYSISYHWNQHIISLINYLYLCVWKVLWVYGVGK